MDETPFAWKSAAAFTLIEMLIVVAIIAIISAAAAPRIGDSICQFRMSQQANALFNTMRSLRFSAVEQDRMLRAIPYREDGTTRVEFHGEDPDRPSGSSPEDDDYWERLERFGNMVIQDCVQLGIGDTSYSADAFDRVDSDTGCFLRFDSKGSPWYDGEDCSQGLGGFFLTIGNDLDDLPDPDDGNREACNYRTVLFSGASPPVIGGRLVDYPAYLEQGQWTLHNDIPDCSSRSD